MNNLPVNYDESIQVCNETEDVHRDFM